MHTARLASFYLVAQGLAGLLWWVLLLFASPVRDLFFTTEDAWLAGRTLIFADVVMFGVASIAAGFLSIRSLPWAQPVAWIALGATGYATLVAIGWILEPIAHWLGAALMLPTLAATCWAVLTIHRRASVPTMDKT